MARRRELAFFPTPPALVAQILERVLEDVDWAVGIEPCCGDGRFLQGLAERLPALPLVGIESEPARAAEARSRLGDRVTIHEGSIFELGLEEVVADAPPGPRLCVGNPPWITNAALGALDSGNRPQRENRLAWRGIEARTGRANFDLTEAVWWKALDELEGPRRIALLCKRSVARRVVGRIAEGATAARAGALAWYAIDARRWFRASVDAGLLVMDLDRAPVGPVDREIRLYESLAEPGPGLASRLGPEGWIADPESHRALAFLDGRSPRRWRQGVKHDICAVLELVDEGQGFQNGLGEPVVLEDEAWRPLRKGRDLRHPDRARPRRGLVLPQLSTKASPEPRLTRLPKLAAYLERHREAFARRRSSVYRRRPEFSIFGLGDYSLSPWKVAVCGFDHRFRFSALGPEEGRPVVVDDTCAILACDSESEARLLALALNSELARGFFKAITDPGEKRPLTIRRLMRCDLAALLEALAGDESGQARLDGAGGASAALQLAAELRAGAVAVGAG